MIYFVMKPLECFFLVVLNMVDSRPEQRISNQYVLREHEIRLAGGNYEA